MGIADRIKQFIEYQGISANQFCKNCGLSNGFLTNAKSIGSDKIEKIIYKYPFLSIEWLVLGVGEMLAKDKAQNLEKTLPEIMDYMRGKDKEIEQLNREIGRLEERLTNCKKD